MTPIFACHGIGMHAGFFARQEASLAPRPLVPVNMPGFGGTPMAPYSFPVLAQSLADQIRKTGGAAHVMGHSMGGMVAQELAATTPELVKSLILLNTTPVFGGKDDSFKETFVAARLAPLDAGQSMAALAEGAVAEMTASETPQADRRFLEALMAETPEAAYRAAIECLVTFDRFADQSSYPMPVLLVGGAEDPAAPARTMEKMAAKIPNARVTILPGRHMTPVEQAKATNQLIKSFLEEVER